MWDAFADGAAQHALLVGQAVVGSCALDEERRLLRFHVAPRASQHATELLRLVVRELDVASAMVATSDPGALSPVLDLTSDLEPHTLLFAPVTEPEGPGLDGLREAGAADLARIVDFQEREVGAPRDFLEHYVGVRLERGEMLLLEEGEELRCVGELRRDLRQPGVAHLGLVVRAVERSQGVGTRMMSSLVTRSRAAGLAPHASTEVANVGARSAMDRAGLRATHRLLCARFAPR
jgi:GNAT superfamily N-acetyltransferase